MDARPIDPVPLGPRIQSRRRDPGQDENVQCRLAEEVVLGYPTAPVRNGRYRIGQGLEFGMFHLPRSSVCRFRYPECRTGVTRTAGTTQDGFWSGMGVCWYRASFQVPSVLV